MQICRKALISVVLCCVLVLMISLVSVIGSRKQPQPVAETSPQLQHFTQIPMAFIENQGQWPDEVAYLARKGAMTAWLQKDGITFRFKSRSADDRTQGAVVQMTFENTSDQVSIEGLEKQSAKHNFFVGNDRTQWRSGVTSYAKVIYKDLYEGIDLCVREHNGWLEYDLLLSESADLRDAVICCDGLKDLRIDDDGVLVMETEHGPITQKLPAAWYELPLGDRLPVTCNFRKIDDQRYGFEVENDLGLALVIDPGLEWSTFLGGSADDHCISMVVTASGHIIIAGATESVDFPTTSGAYDTTFYGGNLDGLVSCLSADGTQLLWSTALGGSGDDVLFDIGLGGSGRLIVGGTTFSNDFPTISGAYDTTHNGDWDGVLARLSSDGSQLLYSTYLGTPSQDMIMALDVHGTGDAVICGYTGSSEFPTTTGAYDTTYNGGIRDAFVARINADGSDLIYSTYLGGSGDDGVTWSYPIVENTDLMNVLLDDGGNVIVSGMTMSADFPTTPGAYDISYNGSWDIFVAKLDTIGSDLVFSTFLGGSSWEAAMNNAMCLNGDGQIAIGGVSASQNFPTTTNAFDTTFNGGTGDWDAIIAILNSAGSQLVYSTFLGGTGPNTGDVITAIASDAAGQIVFAGQAEYGFPVTSGAYDTTLSGPYDICLGWISPAGNGQADLLYSSYIGGDSADGTCDLALVDDSIVIITGFTLSHDFPTTPATVYDTTFHGEFDGFVLRFENYVGVEEHKTNEPFSAVVLSNAFPNPSYREFNYSINLQRSQEVRVSVFDITGRLVVKLIDGQLHAGTHDFSWLPGNSIASGTYFLTLRAGDLSETRKVLLVK